MMPCSAQLFAVMLSISNVRVKRSDGPDGPASAHGQPSQRINSWMHLQAHRCRLFLNLRLRADSTLRLPPLSIQKEQQMFPS
jgi:hypothetical protein